MTARKCLILAEREGFEPPVPFWGTAVFETAAFDHSAISPRPVCYRVSGPLATAGAVRRGGAPWKSRAGGGGGAAGSGRYSRSRRALK